MTKISEVDFDFCCRPCFCCSSVLLNTTALLMYFCARSYIRAPVRTKEKLTFSCFPVFLQKRTAEPQQSTRMSDMAAQAAHGKEKIVEGESQLMLCSVVAFCTHAALSAEPRLLTAVHEYTDRARQVIIVDGRPLSCFAKSIKLSALPCCWVADRLTDRARRRRRRAQAVH
jgi:hypothetical protein